MILTDEEISDLWVTELDDRRTVTTFARAIEAAILAKLASAELPEPVLTIPIAGSKERASAYSSDQLRQAYAQGAAAQLAEKPSGWKCPSCWAVLPKRRFDGYCTNCTSFD